MITCWEREITYKYRPTVYEYEYVWIFHMSSRYLALHVCIIMYENMKNAVFSLDMAQYR